MVRLVGSFEKELFLPCRATFGRDICRQRQVEICELETLKGLSNLYMNVTLTVNRCGTKGLARW
jgi:hypothetical protein